MRRAAVALFASAIALASFTVAELAAIRSRAENLIFAAKPLTIARDPTAEFPRIERTYGSSVRLKDCDKDGCYYTAHVANGALSFLRVVPYGDLDVTFNIFRGELAFVHIQYRSVDQNGQDCTVHIQLDSCTGTCEREFHLDPHGIRQQFRNGSVEFNRAASQREINASMDLNVSCLTSFRGCQTIDQMLPQLWRRTADGRIASRMPSMADAYSDVIVP
jgi:hypothetical protein